MIMVKSGRWLKSSGVIPTRVVMRFNLVSGEYVVHYESVYETGSVGYNHGIYEKDLAVAEEAYAKRVKIFEAAGEEYWSCENILGWLKNKKEVAGK